MYEDIPVLFQGPEEAEKVNRYFVVERQAEPMPGEDTTAVGDTPGIEGFEVWLHGDYGCGLRSALDRCPHYDTNRGRGTTVCVVEPNEIIFPSSIFLRVQLRL